VDEIQRAEDEPVSPEFFPGGDDGGVDADSVSYDDDQW
jgi:hypothetical protein